MDKAFINIKNRGVCLALCVLLFLLPAAGRVRTVSGAAGTPAQVRNASGNQNYAAQVDPVGKNEGFSSVLYDNRNGLPTSEANAIAQSSDGFLWIGSYAGLIRYDGSTFERIDSTTGISNVRCLYVDSLDRLWIGTNDAGLFLMSEGEIRNWNKADGLRSVSIRSIAEGGDGLIYIGTTEGIAAIDDTLELTVMEDEKINGHIIRSFRSANAGLVWGLTQNGDLFTLKNGRVLTFLSEEECTVKGIAAILPDPERPGELFAATGDSMIFHGDPENGFAGAEMIDTAPLSYLECLEYIGGELWVCAGNGIGRLDDSGFHALSNVPMNNSVGHVMTDYEGNLWFSSTRQGIMKIVPNRFSDLFDQYDLPPAVVNSNCLYDGKLFIGTDDGLIVVRDGKKMDSFPLEEAVTASGKQLEETDLLALLKDVRIRSIICDSRDRLWISTWRRFGLLCFEKGRLVVYSQADGLLSDQVRTVSECEDGTILAANNGGLSVIRDGSVAAVYDSEDGIVNNDILTVTEGFRHEWLLGSDGGGIYVVTERGTEHLGTEDGLTSEVILRIKRSREYNVFWIVTSNSLAYMTPDHRITTVRRFPYPNNYDLYENSKGDVWVLASSGIYVAPAEELLSEGAAEPVFLGISSGLPYIATANSYSELTDEGDLYMAGTSGTVKINIEKPFEDISELKISVPYIDADGTRYYPDEEGDFALPGDVHRVTVYPFVFNYSLIDPQIIYRLDPFDSKDTVVSRSRLAPVDYTNLERGLFTFELTAKDPIGHSEQNRTYTIRKGREFSSGKAGSLIMIIASLLLMGGIFLYTTPYRRRKRLVDRLLLCLMLSNTLLCAGELLFHVQEYVTLPFGRALMIAGKTVFYLFLVIFAYLILVYFEYWTGRKRIHLWIVRLLYGIPCFLFCLAVLVNLKTGWIFTVDAGNVYHSGLQGAMRLLPLAPVCFYLLLALIDVFRANRRMGGAGLLLIAGRLAGDLCCPEISSTSFLYALILTSIYLYVMNQPMKEVTL